ncbi:hypothetical protein HK098_005259 [Nowakowskiella sp. JEL0407]|nr:hypothetical protein HK098_005259 [Nowakowskiella sp. JEL0407]
MIRSFFVSEKIVKSTTANTVRVTVLKKSYVDDIVLTGCIVSIIYLGHVLGIYYPAGTPGTAVLLYCFQVASTIFVSTSISPDLKYVSKSSNSLKYLRNFSESLTVRRILLLFITIFSLLLSSQHSSSSIGTNSHTLPVGLSETFVCLTIQLAKFTSVPVHSLLTLYASLPPLMAGPIILPRKNSQETLLTSRLYYRHSPFFHAGNGTGTSFEFENQFLDVWYKRKPAFVVYGKDTTYAKCDVAPIQFGDNHLVLSEFIRKKQLCIEESSPNYANSVFYRPWWNFQRRMLTTFALENTTWHSISSASSYAHAFTSSLLKETAGTPPKLVGKKYEVIFVGDDFKDSGASLQPECDCTADPTCIWCSQDASSQSDELLSYPAENFQLTKHQNCRLLRFSDRPIDTSKPGAYMIKYWFQCVVTRRKQISPRDPVHHYLFYKRAIKSKSLEMETVLLETPSISRILHVRDLGAPIVTKAEHISEFSEKVNVTSSKSQIKQDSLRVDLRFPILMSRTKPYVGVLSKLFGRKRSSTGLAKNSFKGVLALIKSEQFITDKSNVAFMILKSSFQKAEELPLVIDNISRKSHMKNEDNYQLTLRRRLPSHSLFSRLFGGEFHESKSILSEAELRKYTETAEAKNLIPVLLLTPTKKCYTSFHPYKKCHGTIALKINLDSNSLTFASWRLGGKRGVSERKLEHVVSYDLQLLETHPRYVTVQISTKADIQLDLTVTDLTARFKTQNDVLDAQILGISTNGNNEWKIFVERPRTDGHVELVLEPKQNIKLDAKIRFLRNNQSKKLVLTSGTELRLKVPRKRLSVLSNSDEKYRTQIYLNGPRYVAIYVSSDYTDLGIGRFDLPRIPKCSSSTETNCVASRVDKEFTTTIPGVYTQRYVFNKGSGVSEVLERIIHVRERAPIIEFTGFKNLGQSGVETHIELKINSPVSGDLNSMFTVTTLTDGAPKFEIATVKSSTDRRLLYSHVLTLIANGKITQPVSIRLHLNPKECRDLFRPYGTCRMQDDKDVEFVINPAPRFIGSQVADFAKNDDSGQVLYSPKDSASKAKDDVHQRVMLSAFLEFSSDVASVEEVLHELNNLEENEKLKLPSTANLLNPESISVSLIRHVPYAVRNTHAVSSEVKGLDGRKAGWGNWFTGIFKRGKKVKEDSPQDKRTKASKKGKLFDTDEAKIDRSGKKQLFQGEKNWIKEMGIDTEQCADVLESTTEAEDMTTTESAKPSIGPDWWTAGASIMSLSRVNSTSVMYKVDVDLRIAVQSAIDDGIYDLPNLSIKKHPWLLAINLKKGNVLSTKPPYFTSSCKMEIFEFIDLHVKIIEVPNEILPQPITTVNPVTSEAPSASIVTSPVLTVSLDNSNLTVLALNVTTRKQQPKVERKVQPAEKCDIPLTNIFDAGIVEKDMPTNGFIVVEPPMPTNTFVLVDSTPTSDFILVDEPQSANDFILVDDPQSTNGFILVNEPDATNGFILLNDPTFSKDFVLINDPSPETGFILIKPLVKPTPFVRKPRQMKRSKKCPVTTPEIFKCGLNAAVPTPNAKKEVQMEPKRNEICSNDVTADFFALKPKQNKKDVPTPTVKPSPKKPTADSTESQPKKKEVGPRFISALGKFVTKLVVVIVRLLLLCGFFVIVLKIVM